jgi:hypothetical protein
MKSPHLILRSFTSNWKIVALIALPIFAVAMWYGVSHHYEDIGLYSVAMALGSWGIANRSVRLVRHWKEWRCMKSRGGNSQPHDHA